MTAGRKEFGPDFACDKEVASTTSNRHIGDGGEVSRAAPQPWFSFRILHEKPLLTISSTELKRIPLLHLARELPELFDTPCGLHFICPTWSIDVPGGAAAFAAQIAKAQAILPGHKFVPLAATDYENLLLAEQGVPSIFGSGLLFTDERKWKPVPPSIQKLGMFDAIYSARLAPEKRHELATRIRKLILVYPHSLWKPETEARDHVRSVLPKAYFANHIFGNGQYQRFDTKRMVEILAHARCGLCLSAAEGPMRAAMEYLLCGLPVVSTRSIGGRDRYFLGAYCRIVDDDPGAVAAAVRTLGARKLDRWRIRSHVAEILAFDRYNFLFNANKVAKKVLGNDSMLSTIEPLIGAYSSYVSLRDVVAKTRIRMGGKREGA